MAITAGLLGNPEMALPAAVYSLLIDITCSQSLPMAGGRSAAELEQAFSKDKAPIFRPAKCQYRYHVPSQRTTVAHQSIPDSILALETSIQNALE